MRRQDTSDDSKAKAKDLSFQAKAKDKDLIFKASSAVDVSSHRMQGFFG